MHNASERHRKSLNTSVSRKRVVQERKFKQRRHEKSLQVTPRSSKKHARTSTVQASTMRPGRSFRETFLESQREFEKRANFERKMNDLQKLREYEYQKRKALNEQKFIENSNRKKMLKTSQTHRKDKEIETRLSNLYKNRAAKLNKMLETNKKLKKDQEQKLSMRIGMEKTQKEELIERLIQKNKRVEMMRQKHSIAFQKSK